MMLFTFSGTTVLLGLAALSLLTGLTIYCFRLLANRRAGGELPHKIIPSYTQPIHALAFCVAISASLLAINWTVPVTGTELPAYVVEELDIIDTKIPVTKTPPPPPPPPPPPLIEPIQDEIVEEAPVFESQDVTEQDLLPPPAPPAPSAEPTAAPAPPPLPPPPPAEDNQKYIFVQHMPTFGKECMELSGDARKLCSDKALMTFIYQNVHYPALARNNGISGTVVVSFVVEKDGTVSSVEPVRKLGGGLTRAAVDAIEAINAKGIKFSPGIQNEAFVRVKFNMPIKFKLE